MVSHSVLVGVAQPVRRRREQRPLHGLSARPYGAQMFAVRATQNSPPSPLLVERIVAHTKLPSGVQFSPGRALRRIDPSTTSICAHERVHVQVFVSPKMIPSPRGQLRGLVGVAHGAPRLAIEPENGSTVIEKSPRQPADVLAAHRPAWHEPEQHGCVALHADPSVEHALTARHVPLAQPRPAQHGCEAQLAPSLEHVGGGVGVAHVPATHESPAQQPPSPAPQWSPAAPHATSVVHVPPVHAPEQHWLDDVHRSPPIPQEIESSQRPLAEQLPGKQHSSLRVQVAPTFLQSRPETVSMRHSPPKHM